jgi:Raf kinase inhibitor-like YbhB/YbcL family protein
MKFHASFVFIASILVASLALAADFKLSSPEVGPDKPLSQTFVFNGYGCSGGNQSPAIAWSGAPSGTKSYALTLFDPDARQGKGFWHWLMVNIPATTTSLSRDAGKTDGSKAPVGAVQTMNDFRTEGYGGSCPPISDEPHNYVYTVYALKVEKIDVSARAAPESVRATLETNSIGKANLEYHFGRKT